MTNGLEIKDKEEIQEIYKRNPDQVVIFIAENVMDLKKDVYEIKSQYENMFQECVVEIEKKIKPNKLKNFIMQFPGGAISGALVAYLIIKFWLEARYNIKLPIVP